VAGLADFLFSDVQAPEPPAAEDDASVSLPLAATAGGNAASAGPGSASEGPEEEPAPPAAEGDWSDLLEEAPAPPRKAAHSSEREGAREPKRPPEQAPVPEVGPTPEQERILEAEPAEAERGGAAVSWGGAERAAELDPTLELAEPPDAGVHERRSVRRFLAIGAAALGVIAVSSSVGLGVHARSRAREAAFADEIRASDERIQAGRLAGARGDTALDHLAAARELLPDDPRLASRSRLLADKFEELGGRAASRGDLQEAVVHYEAALRADPAREAVRKQLEAIASRRQSPPPESAERGP
jgi:tetratricopeptide (TPR) repeat protein